MSALEIPDSSLLPLFALLCATLNVVLWVLRPVRRGPAPASVALSDP
jgi:hypothetical protein